MSEDAGLVFRLVVQVKQLLCPRCGKLQEFTENGPQAIMNASTPGILASVQCPNCKDLVQVWMAGETYHRLKPED